MAISKFVSTVLLKDGMEVLPYNAVYALASSAVMISRSRKKKPTSILLHAVRPPCANHISSFHSVVVVGLNPRVPFLMSMSRRFILRDDRWLIGEEAGAVLQILATGSQSRD